MRKFKLGDKVRPRNVEGAAILTLGRLYTVTSVFGNYIGVDGVNGWCASRFECVHEAPEVGDKALEWVKAHLRPYGNIRALPLSNYARGCKSAFEVVLEHGFGLRMEVTDMERKVEFVPIHG